MKIDGHQHFWSYNPDRHLWISESMQVLKKDFLPKDLKAELDRHNIGGSIAIQAVQSDDETSYLIGLAEENDFIKGVVGWVDLKSDTLPEKLDYFKTIPIIKGFRHILQDETEDFILDPVFVRGIKVLKVFGYSYDLLVYANQLPASIKLVDQLIDVNLVIDHIAKPDIAGKEIKNWSAGIKELAEFPWVKCKISGLVTEAKHGEWTEDIFKPYLDTIFEAFGPERLIFGSDWPVCLLSASYKQVFDIFYSYIEQFSKHEQDMMFGQNAIDTYKLNI